MVKYTVGWSRTLVEPGTFRVYVYDVCDLPRFLHRLGASCANHAHCLLRFAGRMLSRPSTPASYSVGNSRGSSCLPNNRRNVRKRETYWPATLSAPAVGRFPLRGFTASHRVAYPLVVLDVVFFDCLLLLARRVKSPTR